ncbi:MAG: zf-TFIIB domain-containing protein [Candidatus Omnitrophica bacterium]|nr:zf-TFIIB domain-containing protein [Candidatus Omnitrophota bacterium]MCM8790294.1 zf-TFIIB domain-containing protein [Candidatus Omnitrophota bacterium]
MRCPKCGVDMTVADVEGCEVDECPRCGGIWVDVEEEKSALGMKPTVFTVDEIKRLRQIYQPLGQIEAVKYFKCPRCGELMWRKNYMHHSGIIVDKCHRHGTFFDKGELEKAAEFIKKGGVEYEKLRIAEKGVAETQAKLIRELGRVESTMYRLHWMGRLLSSLGF